jgi:hypothetical protein
MLAPALMSTSSQPDSSTPGVPQNRWTTTPSYSPSATTVARVAAVLDDGTVVGASDESATSAAVLDTAGAVLIGVELAGEVPDPLPHPSRDKPHAGQCRRHRLRAHHRTPSPTAPQTQPQHPHS